MIKKATLEDLQHIVDMGIEFVESLAMPIPYSELDLALTAKQLVTGDNSAVFITDGGMVGGDIMPFFLNRQVHVVQERFWWVNPENRNSGVGKALREAFEDWAQSHGADIGAFMTVTERGEDSLKSAGYFQTEKYYWRVL